MTEKVEKISKMQKEIDNFNTIVEERLAEKAAEFEVTRCFITKKFYICLISIEVCFKKNIETNY